jgi:hypothetical protein
MVFLRVRKLVVACRWKTDRFADIGWRLQPELLYHRSGGGPLCSRASQAGAAGGLRAGIGANRSHLRKGRVSGQPPASTGSACKRAVAREGGARMFYRLDMIMLTAGSPARRSRTAPAAGRRGSGSHRALRDKARNLRIRASHVTGQGRRRALAVAGWRHISNVACTAACGEVPGDGR